MKMLSGKTEQEVRKRKGSDEKRRRKAKYDRAKRVRMKKGKDEGNAEGWRREGDPGAAARRADRGRK